MDKDDPDVQDQELAWVRLAEDGAIQCNNGRLNAAAQSWQQAADIAEHVFDPGDPRRAASRNNVAVLARFEQRMEDAGRLYRQALQEWDRVRGWIEHMEPAQYARSSVFHMRLELKHRQQFARWALDEFFEEQPRGEAITLNNQAEWHQQAGDCKPALTLYRTALSDYETPAAPAHGAAVIRHNRAACEALRAGQRGTSTSRTVWNAALEETFLVQARREEWIVDRPPMFTDEGRFMAALACVCMVAQVGATPPAR